MIRALEVGISPQPPFTVKGGAEGYTALWIGIKLPKEELERRIEQRLNEWFERGLIEETKKLPNPERFGLAYTAIAKYLKGDIDEVQMRTEALRSIKQYAKRQMTWFKKNKNIRWVADAREVKMLAKEWLLV